MTVSEVPPRGGIRRFGRWVLGLVVLVALSVAGAAIGVVVWAHHYQPLGSDAGIVGAGRIIGSGPAPPAADRVIDNALGTEYRVIDPEVGTRIGIAFGLDNNGAHAVRINKVVPPYPPARWTSPQAYMTSTSMGSPDIPFRPFTLGAHRHMDLLVTWEVAGCPEGTTPAPRSEGTESVGGVPVDFSFHNIRRTVTVQLAGYALAVQGWPGCRNAGSRPPVSR